MNNEEAIVKLAETATLGHLQNNEFAKSLLNQHESRGSLSDKQWAWVHKLLQPPGDQKAGYENIPEIFALARTHLKWPKVKVNHWQGNEIGSLRFSVAGERSRYAGDIMITCDNSFYEDRTFYGRIDQDGVFHPSANRHIHLDAILESLNKSLEDFAYEQGVATGHCIFCSLPLTDQRSLTAGYGKRCASNYGLTWGAK